MEKTYINQRQVKKLGGGTKTQVVRQGKYVIVQTSEDDKIQKFKDLMKIYPETHKCYITEDPPIQYNFEIPVSVIRSKLGM